jgi:hypothetical protein
MLNAIRSRKRRRLRIANRKLKIENRLSVLSGDGVLLCA